MNDFSDEFQGYSLLKAYSPLSPKLSASHFVELCTSYSIYSARKHSIFHTFTTARAYSNIFPIQ